ncbi:rCG44786 [Rattus norvegicus]|uniref:RCG44786 n=1 Tax=Rattus norvegicus TaxID=10116 RepID=A6I5D4_RAT|nr:rCG44786 [Rattus norvegicus]
MENDGHLLVSRGS